LRGRPQRRAVGGSAPQSQYLSNRRAAAKFAVGTRETFPYGKRGSGLFFTKETVRGWPTDGATSTVCRLYGDGRGFFHDICYSRGALRFFHRRPSVASKNKMLSLPIDASPTHHGGDRDRGTPGRRGRRAPYGRLGGPPALRQVEPPKGARTVAWLGPLPQGHAANGHRENIDRRGASSTWADRHVARGAVSGGRGGNNRPDLRGSFCLPYRPPKERDRPRSRPKRRGRFRVSRSDGASAARPTGTPTALTSPTAGRVSVAVGQGEGPDAFRGPNSCRFDQVVFFRTGRGPHVPPTFTTPALSGSPLRLAGPSRAAAFSGRSPEGVAGHGHGVGPGWDF